MAIPTLPLQDGQEVTIVRPATEKDCPAMLALVHELAVYEKAKPEDLTITLEHFTESGFGPKPVWWGLVATSADGTIIGFANWYIRFSTWKGQRLYLEDLIVTESYRGKEIGKLLLDEVIAVARKENFSGLSWQVLDWNQPAIDFYKKYDVQMEAGWLNVLLSF